MEIRFWGVRGSVAASGAHVAGIGGNTSCVEVSSGGHKLILDAGTGIRGLGEEILRTGTPTELTLLFSHLHWDHVQGFPFFGPAYRPSFRLRLFGPRRSGALELERTLSKQMEPPTFPVPLSAMRSRLEFGAVEAGSPFEIGPFRVMPFEVPHPQGCMGYRIDSGGRSFVYMTDVELSAGELAPATGKVIEGADVLCLDAQYTPDEYAGRSGPSRRGWGHSTMIEAAKVAFACNARRLFLFHHDPAHNDEQVESMAEEARRYFAVSEPAREGKRIVLDDAA